MNDAIWHRYDLPLWPIKRGPDGRLFLILHNGKVWRRRVDGKWQWTLDEQTEDEWTDTQW